MQMESASYPMERVCVDTLGPFKADSKGFKYCIIFIDYFTRYSICIPVREQSAITTARIFLEQIVYRFGAPSYLLSDRGSNYMSDIMNEIRRMTKTKGLNTTAYHPQTNGLVERFNHTIVQIISLICDVKVDDWSDYIHAACFAYNVAKQSTIDESPFFLMFGRDAQIPGEDVLCYREQKFHSHLAYINQVQDRMSWAWMAVQAHLTEHKDKYLSSNRDLKKIIKFKIGDKVWLIHPMKIKGNISSKFLHPYLGPFEITEVLGSNIYRIRRIGHPKEVIQTVNVGRLKAFYEPIFAPDEKIINQPSTRDLKKYKEIHQDAPILAEPNEDDTSSMEDQFTTENGHNIVKKKRTRPSTRSQGQAERRSYAGLAPTRSELDAEDRREVYDEDSYIQVVISNDTEHTTST